MKKDPSEVKKNLHIKIREKFKEIKDLEKQELIRRYMCLYVDRVVVVDELQSQSDARLYAADLKKAVNQTEEKITQAEEEINNLIMTVKFDQIDELLE